MPSTTKSNNISDRRIKWQVKGKAARIGCDSVRFSKNNSFLFIIGDLLAYFERKVGIFGRFSLELVIGLLFGVGSLLLFAKLTEDLLFDQLLLFDQIGTSFINRISSEQVTDFMIFMSHLGSTYFISVTGICMIIYLVLIRRHFWDAVLVPLALLGGGLLNLILKCLFQRQRPDLPHLVEASGFSFPSGHAMMSFIFYGLLAYLILLNFPHKKTRRTVIGITAAIIFFIGLSRIYLGVHYPSDVLAGFAAGSFWLVACILGLRGIRHYRSSL